MVHKKFFDYDSSMNSTPIPQEYKAFSKMLQQVREKLNHFRGMDIFVLVKADIKGNTFSLGGNANGRKGRNLRPSSSNTPNNGGLSFGSPRANNGGDQQKTAFVKENQREPKSFGFFLCAATRCASNPRWLSHSVPWPFSPVSGNSIPQLSTVSKGDWDGSESETPFRSPRLLCELSIGRWNTQMQAPLLKGTLPIVSSVHWRASGVCLGLAWAIGLRSLLLGKHSTNEKRSLRKSLSSWILSANSSPFLATGWRADVASPVAFGFHGVSYPRIYETFSLFSITYA